MELSVQKRSITFRVLGIAMLNQQNRHTIRISNRHIMAITCYEY